MARPLEGGSFRLKQGCEEKSVTGQFDSAYFSASSRGAHLQSANYQARYISGIEAEAAVIGLANLVRAIDLMEAASRCQLQDFLQLNQRTSELRDNWLGRRRVAFGVPGFGHVQHVSRKFQNSVLTSAASPKERPARLAGEANTVEQLPPSNDTD